MNVRKISAFNKISKLFYAKTKIDGWLLLYAQTHVFFQIRFKRNHFLFPVQTITNPIETTMAENSEEQLHISSSSSTTLPLILTSFPTTNINQGINSLFRFYSI